jgi:hypothetical protein
MSNRYQIEYTDTFGGDANYSWVRRATVTVPELTHYGYTGSTDGSYGRANRIANRELMKLAKARMGLTNVRGRTTVYGDTLEFRPYGMCTVMFVTFVDD